VLSVESLPQPSVLLYAKLDVLDARGDAVDDLLLGRRARRLHGGGGVVVGVQWLRVVLSQAVVGLLHSRGGVSHVLCDSSIRVWLRSQLRASEDFGWGTKSALTPGCSTAGG
jgi:hypothetical protein